MAILKYIQYMLTCDKCKDVMVEYGDHYRNEKDFINDIAQKKGILKIKGKFLCNDCKTLTPSV